MIDFTVTAYLELLLKAKSRFNFIIPGEEFVVDAKESICIWRHDVDVSPHRAIHLAHKELEVGVRAVYFFMLGSRFYNIFEPSISSIVKEIAKMGHGIGLHFDASRYQDDIPEHMELKLRGESEILANLTGGQINSFSLHDPTSEQGKVFLSLQPIGLFNASFSSYVDNFTYCSDSNGFWRYRSLHDILEDQSVSRLYALTHPEWWAPESATPRRRIQRAIDGRAARCAQEYDQGLAKFGRLNN